MRKSEKVKFITQILDHHFPTPKIPLSHKDPYTLLIAVLLSARCTDKKVNEITPKLFLLADCPQKMILLTKEEIQSIIKPIGLSSTKAKAIWDLSLILINKHQGKVPCNFEELEELPGVGHKTASVIMTQSFHIPAFPVDTHIHRLAKRWGLSLGKNVIQTENDLKKLFPKNSWNKIHLQMIYFGRTFCKAKGHEQNQCPICSFLFN